MIVHDLATKKVARRIDLPREFGTARTTAAVSDKILIVSATDDIRAYDITTGKEVGKFDNKDHSPRLMALSPDGKWLLTAGHNLELRVWDMSKRKQLHKLQITGWRIDAIAISSDGKWCAAATKNLGKARIPNSGLPRLWVFDRAKGTERSSAPLLLSSVKQLYFMPGDKSLLVTGIGAYGGINIWDWQESSVIRGGGPPTDGNIKWEGPKLRWGGMCWSSMAKDGTLLELYDKKGLRLWFEPKPQPDPDSPEPKKKQPRKLLATPAGSVQ